MDTTDEQRAALAAEIVIDPDRSAALIGRLSGQFPEVFDRLVADLAEAAGGES